MLPGRVGARTPVVVVAALVVMGIVLGACGSTTSPPAAAGSAGSTSPTIPPTTPSSPAPGGTTAVSPVYEIMTGHVAGIGTVLVDGQGMTLYLFEPDHGSGRSTCYGLCASGWPPLALPTGVTNPVAGPGVDSALLATTTRRDGTKQLTYNGWPLYLWVNDAAPGQATGQGLNNLGGVWWTVTPKGQADTSTP
jgi:predicted lipoprotein with Yx(FWY)xxD motif